MLGKIVGLTLLASSMCNAQDTSPSQSDINVIRQQLEDQSKSIAEQQKQLSAELKKLEIQRKALEDTQRRLDAMQTQLGMPVEFKPQNVAQAEQPVSRGRGSDTSSQDNRVDVATVFSEPTILTPKGSFIFEPSLQYAYSSSDRVSIIGFSVLNAVLIGQIDVRSVNDTTWIASVAGRYGLTNRLEIEAKLPYVYRMDGTLTRSIGGVSDSALFDSNGNGLGDIELAARYQLNLPKGDDPYYIAGLRFKTRTGKDQFSVTYDPNFNLPTELPTGSGFYSLQPSLSAVLPSDPAVFFGGINYIWNIKRDVNATIPYQNNGTYYTQHIGEVDPGDSVGLNFGIGLALNERSSFSLSYEHDWVGKTKVNGEDASDQLSVQLATLQVGFSYRLNKNSNLNLSVGAGLTPDTPGTTVTLRVPIKF